MSRSRHATARRPAPDPLSSRFPRRPWSLSEDDEIPTIEGWPAAPLVAVALDVAQNEGREREILEEWSLGHDISL